MPLGLFSQVPRQKKQWKTKKAPCPTQLCAGQRTSSPEMATGVIHQTTHSHGVRPQLQRTVSHVFGTAFFFSSVNPNPVFSETAIVVTSPTFQLPPTTPHDV